MKKVAIVGPESTGKSTLSAQLAHELGTVWVPEYAREYLDKLAVAYDASDLEVIAKGQLELEVKMASQAKDFLICDTNLLVIEVWAEHAYGNCPEWIRNHVRSNLYDCVFLTNIDLPWQPDPLREHPHLRQYFLQVYHEKLIEIQQPFTLISGNEDRRRLTALNHLKLSNQCFAI